MKEKTVFVCKECGYVTQKWMGRCPQCGSWNTLIEEERIASPKGTQAHGEKAVPLRSVTPDDRIRLSTGFSELDRVLGGGLVKGMVVLLGGDPGIGKSTLLLEVADRMSANSTVLYVSGEESRSQLRLRADRLGIESDPYLYCETGLEAALDEARSLKAGVLIVDSVQTMQTEQADSAAGSASSAR